MGVEGLGLVPRAGWLGAAVLDGAAAAGWGGWLEDVVLDGAATEAD